MNEKKIITIASNTKSYGLKNNYPFKATVKNKICGDEISVEINKDIDEMRFETKSCIFTQASAAILSNHFKKLNKFGLKKVLDIIIKRLNGENLNLPVNIKDLKYLSSKEHKTRKNCIELPFIAIIKAIHD